MPPLPHRPALAPTDGSSDAPSLSGRHYTNEEVGILYNAVSRAEEILSELPEEGRFPSNALLRAYDEVLPQYGIQLENIDSVGASSTDNDRWWFMFFRICGMQGPATLVEKFKAALESIGIELELVDYDSQTEASWAPVDSEPAVSNQASPASHRDTHARRLGQPASPAAIRARQDQSSSSLKHHEMSPAVSQQNHDHPERRAMGPAPGKQATTTLPIRSTAALPERPFGNHLPAPNDVQRSAIYPEQDPTARPGGRAAMQSAMPPQRPQQPAPTNFNHARQQTGALAPSIMPPQANMPSEHYQPQPQEVSRGVDIPPGNFQQMHQTAAPEAEAQPAHPVQELGMQKEMESEEHLERLEWLASRAWNLFTLTRGLSHWSVWAEEKAERTAVARRHMVRFRTFGPWADQTAESSRFERHLRLTRSQLQWSRLTTEVINKRQSANRQGQVHRIRHTLQIWNKNVKQHPATAQRRSNTQLARAALRQWNTKSQQTTALQQQATASCLQDIMGSTLVAWIRCLVAVTQHTEQMGRRVIMQDGLHLWELAAKAHAFRTSLRRREAGSILESWHQTAERLLPRHRPPPPRNFWSPESPFSERQPDPDEWSTSQRHLVMRTLFTWRQETQSSQEADAVAWDHIAGTLATSCLHSWSGVVAENKQLSKWASRADRYVKITTSLQAARQVARPNWSSNTRRQYARARWVQKQLIVRRYLSTWKRTTRSTRDAARTALANKPDLDSAQLAACLQEWQLQSQGLEELDWQSHIPSHLLNEWVVSQEESRLLQEEAIVAWEHAVKVRLWAKWRSISLHLNSHGYVAKDLAEKNVKKSAQRLLQNWKDAASVGQRASTTRPSSFGTSSYFAPRSTQAQGTSLWSRTQSRPTAASSVMMDTDNRAVQLGAEPDDMENAQSDNGEAGDVINTPTKWTGLGSSLLHLPTTTPMAPLSTPFERQLRGQYRGGQSQRAMAQSERFSVRGTPRLSLTEARIVAERRRTQVSKSTGPSGRA